jgi:hypothetical protein
MTFINEYLLWGLLLAAIPILIHLINQRRHRTIEWGAMMFLLSAKKMSRGMALLKQILIMAARMLAIIGLILAICRPMATGWFGALTGGKPETVIVILDRSASMKQQQLSTGETKLDSGLVKIANMISAFDSSKQIVLIESTDNKPVDVQSPEALVDYPKTFPTDSTADVPAMIQTAMEYISDNQTGRTDIWICSDAKQNDWDPESTRWDSLRSGFAELDGVRFHVLNYAEEAEDNFSVVVDRAERTKSSKGVELVLDVFIRRQSTSKSKEDLRLTFTINGVKTVLDVEIENEEYQLVGHRIPLDAGVESGWGMIELPADSNESDNIHYFSFAEQPVYETVIVSDDEKAVESLQLVGSMSMEPGRQYSSKVVGSDQLGEVDWNQTALLIWQAPLPQEREARQISNFVNNGRTVIFFPPDEIDDTEFEGVSWGTWERNNDEKSQSIGFWRNEDDLLQKTRNGQSLPVNKIKVYQYCSLNGDGRTLAKLDNGSALLRRKTTDTGGVYFCSTLPDASHSSLARNGVVMFAMIHRALASGASSIGKAKQLVAGSSTAKTVTEMNPLTESSKGGLIETRPFNSGVYGTEDQIVALNRPSIEDTAKSIPATEVDALFDGLDYHIIDDKLGSSKSLASEAWKLFIVIMGLAILAEAIFCLPPKPDANPVELGGTA